MSLNILTNPLPVGNYKQAWKCTIKGLHKIFMVESVKEAYASESS
jgi:hypothetical protein